MFFRALRLLPALTLVLLAVIPGPFTLAGAKVEKNDPAWLVDLPAAKEEAVRAKKAILLDFTGSDWCAFCRKFKKDVLDQPEFRAFARTNLVLVEVDFPERKKQPILRAKANEALKKEFAIGIYPTFVLLSADGTELGRQVGYLKGGPKAFIEKLERFRQPPK